MNIDKMRAAGKLAALVLNYAISLAKPGISTEEIDRLVEEFIRSNNATPAPLGYKGYPKSTCISVNQIICHGLPNNYVLKQGDSVNIDVTVILDGHFGDTSRSFIVDGEDTPLIIAARGAMMRGIEMLKPGVTMGDIGFAINKFVTRNGFSVVELVGGHGIGTQFHTAPWVPSFGKKGRGDVLSAGMCITVEPLLRNTSHEAYELAIPGSDITELKVDGLGAQFEHTVLITDTGYEILTV